MLTFAAPARIRCRRALASFLACLYGFGVFASLVHVAVVEHVRCAEHGEVVHADEPDANARLGARAPSLSDGLSEGPPREPHAEHEHCFVLAPAQPDAKSERRPELTASRGEAVFFERAFSAPAPVPAVVARWRIAPKQSPPA